MLSIRDFFIYLFIMAGVTYLIRALPLVIFKGKITKQICAKLSLLCAIRCAWSNDFPVHTFLNGKPCGFHSRTYNSLRACIQGKSLIIVAAFACLASFCVILICQLI